MLEGISKQSAFAATRGSPSAMLKKGGWMCLFVGLLEIMLPLLLLLAALRDVNLKPFAVDEGC